MKLFVQKAIVRPGYGILAADESTGTIGKRFEKIKVENNNENRRAYRELLFTTPSWEKHISGVIMYEETLDQKTADGKLFVEIMKEKGIIPGIKVIRYLVTKIHRLIRGLYYLEARKKRLQQQELMDQAIDAKIITARDVDLLNGELY